MIQRTDHNLFNDDAETEADHFQYDGHDFDPEVGLQYHRANHFDPTIGRWISDPESPR